MQFSYFPLMLHGLYITLQVSLGAIAIGAFLGTLMGVLTSNRLSIPIVTPLIKGWVTVIRGTPVFVQLLIVYFALPYAIGLEISAIMSGIITLGINSGAYFAEMLRGGINSLSDGQWEAAYTLGYSPTQALNLIILPQAIRRLLPAVTGELIALIKESSILLILGVPELTKVSKDIVANRLEPMEVYSVCAFFYFFLTCSIQLLSKKIEKRWRIV